MALKAYATWTVLPHGPLEPLTDGLWRVEGSLPDLPLKRVMAIARRTDGGLVVHNPIALAADAMAALDGLGPVAALIVPNGWHRLDAGVYHRRYPEATVLCPPHGRRKVEEVVPVTATYPDAGPLDPDLRLEVLDGLGGLEGVLIVRRPDGHSLVFNDAVFNMPHLGGVKGFVLRHLTQSSGGPKVSRFARWVMVKDRAAYRAHLERLAALPDLRRILVAHHETIDREPAAALRRVAATLA